MNVLIKFLIASFLLTLSLIFESNAVNFTWTGTTNSAWNTTTNWSPNGLPDSLDNVIIGTATNSPLLS